MAKLLYGKNVSDALSKRVLEEVSMLRDNNIEPTLAIIRVGQREDDIAYETSAVKRCEASNVKVKKYTLKNDISQIDLVNIIKEIKNDPKLNGILLLRQL